MRRIGSNPARVLPVLAWLAASCLLYSHFLASPTRGVPGGADGTLYAWHFAWVQHALWHGENPLISHALNAPTGVSVMWNTGLILVAVLVSPLTALIGAVPTVGLMMMLAPVLSASCAYFVFRSLTARTAGSLLAATLYGFGPFFIGQAGHLHLTFAAPALPLIFYFGHRIYVTQASSARRDGIGLGVVVSMSMLVSEEIVAMAAVIAVMSTIVAMAVNTGVLRTRMRYTVRALLWSVVVTVVVLALPLGYQFLGPLRLTSGIPSTQSVDVASLVIPSRLQLFGSAAAAARNEHFHANDVENTGYLGVVMIIVALIATAALLTRRRRWALWWLGTLIWSVALSFGSRIYLDGHYTGLHGPWALFDHLPALESLVAVRFTLATTFLVALGLALALGELTSLTRYFAGCLAVCVALLSLAPAHRYSVNDPSGILDLRSSRFFSSSAVKTIPAGALTLVMPVHYDPDSAAQLMYWQIESGIRFDMISGYSVFSVDGQPYYLPPLPYYAQVLQRIADTAQPLRQDEIGPAAQSLLSSGLRYIVLGSTTTNKALVAAAVHTLTGCTPRTVDDVVLCQV